MAGKACDPLCRELQKGRVLANWLDDQPGVTGTRLRGNGIRCRASGQKRCPLKHLTVHCGRLDEGAKWKPS